MLRERDESLLPEDNSHALAIHVGMMGGLDRAGHLLDNVDVFSHFSLEIMRGTSTSSHSYAVKASPVCCISYNPSFLNHVFIAFLWEQQQLPTWKSNLREVLSAFLILYNLI